MEIYRAVPKGNEGRKLAANAGRRLPSVVSYVADNLWEFTRPTHLPSRRQALYASSTPELALASAAADAPDGYVACRLKFDTLPAMYQLPVTDARYHKDITNLQKAINKKLRDWNNRTLADKIALAPLFVPGITKEELQAAMDQNELLRAVVEDAAAQVTFWNADQATVAPTGELFFELLDGNTGTLHPV